MKFTKQDLIKIYNDAKNYTITYRELEPIKKELFLITRNFNESFASYLGNLIILLLVLHKENKLSYFNQDFLDFVKKTPDYEYIPSILFGLTYDNNRLGNNLFENEILFLNINSFYEGIYNILETDTNAINYLINSNMVVANIIANYIPLKENILNDNELNLDNKLVLLSILNHIATIFYINHDAYENDYNILEKAINHIKDNIFNFRMYFIDNYIYDEPSFIGSISSGGLAREIYIIGNIINDIYNKKIIVKKRQDY